MEYLIPHELLPEVRDYNAIISTNISNELSPFFRPGKADFSSGLYGNGPDFPGAVHRKYVRLGDILQITTCRGRQRCMFIGPGDNFNEYYFLPEYPVKNNKGKIVYSLSVIESWDKVGHYFPEDWNPMVEEGWMQPG